MLGEAAAMCNTMISRPLSFSPPPSLDEAPQGSPVY